MRYFRKLDNAMNVIQTIIWLFIASCLSYHVLSYQLKSGKLLQAPKRLHCNARHAESHSALPVGPIGTTSTSTLKTMVFMDGTWLYYSLVQGRTERSCPVARKFGVNWHQTHHVDWSKLPSIIAGNIREQLSKQKVLSQAMNVDITRSSVFTSLRADTEVGSLRDTMLHRFYQNNFDVHRFETKGTEEKCVDISLAVEMLFMATVPNAYDIAVILTGDKDFMPALEKTRLLGKRTAICSIRNSINQDMLAPEARIRDFDVIWLDEYLDQLIVPIAAEREKRKQEVAQVLLEAIVQILQRAPTGTYSSRDMGRELQSQRLHDADLLTHLKAQYKTMRAFMEKYNILFTTCADRSNPENSKAFMISLQADYLQHYAGVRAGTLPERLSSGSPSSAMAWLSRASALRNKKGTDTNVADTSAESKLQEQWEVEALSAAAEGSGMSAALQYEPPSSAAAARDATSQGERDAALDGKFRKSTTAQRTRELLLALIHKLFAEQQTDVLNSRTVGRYLQAQSVGDDRWPNALTALKALFGGLLNYCEAYSAVLEVEPEVDPVVGGFNLRMLQPVQTEDTAAALEVCQGTAEDAGVVEGQAEEDQWMSAVSAAPSSLTTRPLSPRQLANTHTASSAGSSISSNRATSTNRGDSSNISSSGELQVSDLKVSELKAHLKALQLPTTGNKQDLQLRLINAQ